MLHHQQAKNWFMEVSSNCTAGHLPVKNLIDSWKQAWFEKDNYSNIPTYNI